MHPIGLFDLGLLYYRDRLTKLNIIKNKNYKKKYARSDDPSSKFYNKEIKINKFIKHEKFIEKIINMILF